jgi:hypothetical protein
MRIPDHLVHALLAAMHQVTLSCSHKEAFSHAPTSSRSISRSPVSCTPIAATPAMLTIW